MIKTKNHLELCFIKLLFFINMLLIELMHQTIESIWYGEKQFRGEW